MDDLKQIYTAEREALKEAEEIKKILKLRALCNVTILD